MITLFRRVVAMSSILIVAGLPAFSQSTSYTVLKVAGDVYCERLQKNLHYSDKITSEDKLRFNRTSAYLVVLNPQEGRKVVRGVQQDTSSELKDLLIDVVSLEKKHTASRGEGDISGSAQAIKRLRSQLDVDTLVILGSGKASFANSDLLLNDTVTIKARFRADGSYSEKSVSIGPVLDLSRDAVFGDHPLAKVQLIYFPNTHADIFDSPPESLGTFVPRYLAGEESIRNEVQIISDSFSGEKQEIVLSEIKKYIQDEYGNVLEENLV